jgi:glyoxylase-like metal-dependent hydrolase (beta-lactamase superfamily II)
MGNLSDQSGWQRPITPEQRKKLRLVDGVLSSQLANGFRRQIDPYQVAVYVSDTSWLETLTPRVPIRQADKQLVVRARHATLLLEIDTDEVLIDPGLDTVIENANPSVIAVTHAHNDHSGGLLTAANLYPKASILMTAETFQLLQLLPDDQASAVKRLIQERGQLHLADGIPFRIYDIEYRLFPAGHLAGAAMIDVQKNGNRVLVTGDFALREIGGLPGGVWPLAEYDAVIMESSHAWDRLYPTAAPETNWRSLITACQNAIDAGATRLIVLASALGEAQDAYFALCKAQMEGEYSTFTLRLAGKAARVAELYATLASSPLSPWRNAIRTLNSKDYLPDRSIVITGGFENADGIGSSLVDAAASDTAIIKPSIGFTNSPGTYTYSVSLHASFSELFATAIALNCREVALYHGQLGKGEKSPPLTKMLESVGRRVEHLAETPKRIGGIL